MLIRQEEVTIEGFKKIFRKIIEVKEKSGIAAIQNNPPDLFDRAKSYGTRFKNGAWGWTSNIWHRSAAGSVVVEKEEDLKPEHKLLMMRVLEHILAQGPMIQVDATLGPPGSRAAMHCRLYCDPQFPDVAYRWSQMNFPADPSEAPDVEVFNIPHYMSNPIIPGTSAMLQVLRFPFNNYTIVTASSYQGEVKKGFLTHWIYHVYKKGGTGEHAALREFTVRKTDDIKKRIVMCIWALTGGGKSTHSMYVFNKHNANMFIEKFGVDPTKYVSDQVARNDDIVAVFEDQVIGSEWGSWTKTEDVDKTLVAQWRAGMSARALHENTEFGPDGNPSFKGELFQYFGKPNRNARSVFYLEDTGYFDGKVVSSEPLNTAVFVSPGYTTDYAWVKIQDPAFAAKVLADGRSVGHPAIAKTGIGEELYETRYCLPFTMGVGNAAHVERFYGFLKKRKDAGNPIDVYLLNTTGKVGAEYEWVEKQLGEEKVQVPKTKFKEIAGRTVPVGGTGPSIEETELFLLQAVRGAVKYQSHPIWGEKVLAPIEVEGISKTKLKELDPFTYRSADEMKRLLKTQIAVSKYYLDKQCLGLPKPVYDSMDF